MRCGYLCYDHRKEYVVSEKLSHRDLRDRSAEILRDVGAGATYEITNHGVVVAVLSPPSGPLDLRVRAATTRGGWRELDRIPRPGNSTREVLDDLRGER